MPRTYQWYTEEDSSPRCTNMLVLARQPRKGNRGRESGSKQGSAPKGLPQPPAGKLWERLLENVVICSQVIQGLSVNPVPWSLRVVIQGCTKGTDHFAHVIQSQQQGCTEPISQSHKTQASNSLSQNLQSNCPHTQDLLQHSLVCRSYFSSTVTEWTFFFFLYSQCYMCVSS